MEWLGYTSVAAMVEERVKESAFKNPGPLRTVSLRLPISSEARLVVLSELLGTQKSTLMRDLLMTSLLETENKLLEDLIVDDEAREDYHGRVEQYRESLMERADVKTGDPEISAKLTDVRKAGGE